MPYAEGAQDLIQLLTPDGERVEHADYPLTVSPEEYRNFYADMVFVRRMDAEATALQRQGELGLWASCLGQEAAQVGSSRALQPQDMAFPTYREHGVAHCRGVDPLHLLAMFRGVDHGAWDPTEHNMHLYTIVIGDQTLHATGYAMGVAKDGKVGPDDPASVAVIAYLGDGATSQGDVSEAFIWSSVFTVPVVFFCQNNQYAISEPVERQSRTPLYRRSAGFGFPGVRVDGNDVLANYAVTKVALDRARHGEGPSLIESFTYRMGAHTTSDDPTRYRIASEVEAWQARDPIARLRTFLSNEGLADEDFFQQITADADKAAIDLRTRCLALPNPRPLSIFDYVYASEAPLLDEQRDAYAGYLAGFAGPASEGAHRGGGH